MRESKVTKLFVFETILGVLWLLTLGLDIIDMLSSSVVGAYIIGFPKTKAGWCEDGTDDDFNEDCQSGPVSLFLLSQALLAIPVALHTFVGVSVSSLQFRKMGSIIAKLVLQGITIVFSLVVFGLAFGYSFLSNSPDHPLGPSTDSFFLISGIIIGVVFFVIKLPCIGLYVAILILSKFTIAEDRREAALRKSQGSETNTMDDEEEMEEHDIELSNHKGRDHEDSNAEPEEGDRNHRREPPMAPTEDGHEDEEPENDGEDMNSQYEAMRRQAEDQD